MKRILSFILTLSLLLLCTQAMAGDAASWVCPQCKEAVDGGYAFCPGCGTGQTGRAVCQACGYAPEKAWPAFCPMCGTAFGAGAASHQVGDRVTFGRYEQDGDPANGAEPIDWLIIDMQDGVATLLCIPGLDAAAYHSGNPYPTWENSDLRAWLNGTFPDAAFSPEEQASIVHTHKATPGYEGGADTEDPVWLLSREEVSALFHSEEELFCTHTAYARQQKAWFKSGNGRCWWWLRSTGYGGNSAASVGYGGTVYSNDVDSAFGTVRPVIRPDLKAAGL